MKVSIKILIISLLFFTKLVGQNEKIVIQKVRIHLEEKPLSILSKYGIELEHGYFPQKKVLINYYDENIIITLINDGFKIDILEKDAIATFIEKNAHAIPYPTGEAVKQRSNYCNLTLPTYPQPVNFKYGSMGGYLTYDEILSELTKMSALYPHIISEIQNVSSVFKTAKGKYLKYVKLSDNPSFDESEIEPNILYTALHHAREPISAAQQIYFMWYLLENYDSNPEIKYLVDHSELYFIPCVNPDGYIYNQNTYPNGGGFWRKNRNGEVQVGVDLNRNYGVGWGYDDIGSSDNKNSDTYRGTIQFSEAETKALKSFFSIHNFKIASNAHSFGNVLIHPWGYKDILPSDSLFYFNLREFLTHRNDFSSGLNTEVLDYSVNGTSDDWMYGEGNGLDRTYAFTEECGANNLDDDLSFWPTLDKIVPICDQMIESNIRKIWLALNYTKVNANTPQFIPLKNEILCQFNFKNIGLISQNTNIEIKAISPNVEDQTQSDAFSLLSLQDYTLTHIVKISDLTQDQHFLIEVSVNYGDYTKKDTFDFKAIKQNTYFVDHCDNMNQFKSSDPKKRWFISGNSFNTIGALRCTENKYYSKAEDREIESSSAIKLGNDSLIYLQFASKWDIEKNKDYFKAYVSTDEVYYQPLCGDFSSSGSIEQIEFEPVIDGYQPNWVIDKYDLSEFRGKDIFFRFIFRSDGKVFRSGITIDEINIMGIPYKQTISTGQISADDQFAKIYPNPFSDIINIDPLLIQKYELLELIDFSGKKLKEYQLNSNETQINVNESILINGIYYIRLSGKDIKPFIHKMVKI